MEENTRLSDLTHMLLSFPSSSSTQAAQVPQQQSQNEQYRHVCTEINHYAIQQQMQQQQIGMTIISEHTMGSFPFPFFPRAK
jgi:hypothetical protein